LLSSFNTTDFIKSLQFSIMSFGEINSLFYNALAEKVKAGAKQKSLLWTPK